MTDHLTLTDNDRRDVLGAAANSVLRAMRNLNDPVTAVEIKVEYADGHYVVERRAREAKQ